MRSNRPLLSRPTRTPPPALKAVPRTVVEYRQRPHRTRTRRQRDARQSLYIALSLFVLFGLVALGGYGIHARVQVEKLRAEAAQRELADATGAELRTASVLFVPRDGNTCRRRWLDNETWRVHDGGAITCDDEVTWNSNQPDNQPDFGQRIDAVRSGFRQKGQ